MPGFIGKAVLDLDVDARKYDKGVGKAEQRAGKLGAAFGKAREKGASIPTIGPAIGALANPIGIVTVAVGGLAAGLGASLKSVMDTERELRPMIERSRFAAESLQVLSEAAVRAGSEDGLEAIVDTSQELQLQLGELALTGAARAEEALDALGLKASELQAMEPEAAWRAVVEEIQKIPNVADRAIAAEEIFGGTSEKLSGIINLTTAEFAALEDQVVKTSDLWSGDTLTAAKDLSLELQYLKTDLGRGANAIIAEMLPALVSVVRFVRTEALPVWQEFKAMALSPVTDWITGTLIPAVAEMAPLLIGTFGAFAKEILPAMSGALVPIVDAFQRLFDTLSPVLPQIVALGQRLLAPQTIFQKLASKIFPILEPHLGTIAGIFADLANSVLPALSSIFKGGVTPAIGSATGILESLAPVIANVADTAGGVLKTALEIGADLFNRVMAAVTPLIPQFAAMAQNLLPMLADLFMRIMDAVSPLLPLLGDILMAALDAIVGVLPQVSEFLQIVISAFGELFAALEPALPLLAELAYELIKALATLLLEVGVALAPLIPLFAELALDILVALIPVVLELLDALLPLIPVILELVNAILPPLLIILTELIEAITPLIVLLAEGLVKAVEILSPILVGLVEIVAGVLIGIIEFRHGVKTALDFVLGGIMSFAGAFGRAWRDIANKIKAPINAIIGAINALIRGWNSLSFDLPSFDLPSLSVPAPTLTDPFRTKKIGGGSFGGSTISVPKIPLIPTLDTGGIVTAPTVAALAMNNQPEAVIPLSELQRLGGDGLGGNTYITVEGTIIDTLGLINAVAEARLEGDRLGIGLGSA